MTKEEKIWIASVALGKSLSYEELKDSDYMYDNRDQTDDVWSYVQEAREKGLDWFRKEYASYKTYPI